MSDPFSTPEKMKEYLDEEGVEYQSDMEDSYLKGLCVRRAKRKAGNNNDQRAKRSLLSGDTATTVAKIKKIMAKMLEQNKDFQPGDSRNSLFKIGVRFIIDEIPHKVTMRKHSLNNNECKGNIVDGQCKKCGMYTDGVVGYSFETLIKDPETDDLLLKVRFNDNAASSLIGMSAAAFNNLADRMAAMDKLVLEKVEEIPILGDMVIKFDPIAEDFLTIVYNAEVLPPTLKSTSGGSASTV